MKQTLKSVCVAFWSTFKVQTELALSLVTTPCAHPSAFFHPDAPPELRQISNICHDDNDFLARIEEQEIYFLLQQWAEDWSSREYDKIEFAKWDFENLVNLELFTNDDVFGTQLYVTEANFGSGVEVHYEFFSRSAADIIDKLASTATQLVLHRTVEGLYCLQADNAFFIIEKASRRATRLEVAA